MWVFLFANRFFDTNELLPLLRCLIGPGFLDRAGVIDWNAAFASVAFDFSI